MTDQELAQMVNRVWADLPLEDKDPDPSTKTLLCVLFREWGRRDQDEALAALRNLSRDLAGKVGIRPDDRHEPVHPLRCAILDGYGARNPAAAWERLGKKSSDDGLSVWASSNSGSVEMLLVMDRIFARLLAESPEKAVDSVEAGHPFRKVAIRILLANMDNHAERLACYNRWLGKEAEQMKSMDPFSGLSEFNVVPFALTGLAEQDPDQAWELLPDSPYFAEMFVQEWARHQPVEALTFLESTLTTEVHSNLRTALGSALLFTQPERAVEYFSRLELQEQSDIIFGLSYLIDPIDPQWPVVEGMKPGIPIEELRERWRKALDDPSVPPAILEMFDPLLEATD